MTGQKLQAATVRVMLCVTRIQRNDPLGGGLFPMFHNHAERQRNHD